VGWRCSHLDKAQTAHRPHFGAHGHGPLDFHTPTEALFNLQVPVTFDEQCQVLVLSKINVVIINIFSE
jgi:hypothetical protein